MEEFTKQLDALMAAGQWDRAEELLRDRLSGAATSGSRAAELSVCSELLGFYRMRADEKRFAEIYRRTMALLEGVSMPGEARGTILVNAATGLVAFGRAEEALPLYKQAGNLLRGALPRGDFLLAALYNNLSSAYAALGRFREAEENLLAAMDELRRSPFQPDVATSYVNLAQLYTTQDPADPRIGRCLERAMEWLDQPEMIWNEYYAHTARKCAGGFESLGRSREAAELRERAELIYEGT